MRANSHNPVPQNSVWVLEDTAGRVTGPSGRGAADPHLGSWGPGELGEDLKSQAKNLLFGRQGGTSEIYEQGSSRVFGR